MYKLLGVLLLVGCSAPYQRHETFYYGCLNGLVMAYSRDIDDSHSYPSHQYMVDICKNADYHYYRGYEGN